MHRKILVTGGAGYIGSHMVRKLLSHGTRPVVLDNLSTGHLGHVPENVVFLYGDLTHPAHIAEAFHKHRYDAVMHFAASSQVGESVQNPLKYYMNNVSGFLHLMEAVRRHRVRYFIFSSTAAVYGSPASIPIEEGFAQRPINPYGASKLMIERMLRDTAAASEEEFCFAALRYFNAAGADDSGEIGEAHEQETHLIPNLMNALKNGTELNVYGNDYPTADGTCLRDYVHVDDLCEAHFLALEHLFHTGKSDIFNLGSGRGHTIGEVIECAEAVTGRRLRRKVLDRRAGDPAKLVADISKAERFLKWKPERSLEDILRSAWKWHTREENDNAPEPFLERQGVFS